MSEQVPKKELLKFEVIGHDFTFFANFLLEESSLATVTTLT